jgi:beta-galactosidase
MSIPIHFFSVSRPHRKSILSALTLAFVSFSAVAQQPLPIELQTPEIVAVNRMPMRASAFAYENKDLAVKREKEKSTFFMSLNGQWKFNWVQDPNKRPDDFYKTTFNDKKWVNFKVPANWETNGYGLPIYVNHPYEFAGRKKTGARLNPPFDIPADNNPVGSYRKKFNVPQNWDGRQIFIHLGAVKSAFFIWINGVKVGYSEDSKLAAEFDITKYIKPGENLIALQVYRWSDGSYLECQDMWRISGIERDVYLYATPKLDVRDFKTIATLDPSYKNGLLSVNAEINNYKIDQKTNHSRPDTFKVELELLDPKGNSIYKDETKGIKTVLGNYKTAVSFNAELQNVASWSAEIPHLYTLLITLRNKSGEVLEVVPQRIGFRSVELINNNFLVNGKRVFFKGVNRHEHNAKQGHTLTNEDMRKDMEMMKKLNVNAVRHSHYPPDPYWMELCDEFGLYVVDEANIESHGRYYDLAYSLGNDKQWRTPHLERIKRMYVRDKNHASVVTWSLGNEAGNGVNFYEGYDWLKANDIRPVQYERAENDYNTDMIVPQYPDPNWLKRYANSKPKRPLIMSEFAHIMGNSLGNFKEYWDVIEHQPNLQGGFIWEWIDQAIDTVKNGKRFNAYGGDFPLNGPVDEDLSDNNFCVKGVVTNYRGMTPMAVEVKKVYQYIKTAYVGNNKITINNSYFFKGTDNLKLEWELLADGKLVEHGILGSLSIDPRTEKEYILPIKTKVKSNTEYFLNVYYKLKQAEPFLPAGYNIAAEQLAWSGSPVPFKPNAVTGKLFLTKNTENTVIAGKDFKATFDMTKGIMKSYSVNDLPLLSEGPSPAFWRAPTDNDIGAGFNRSLRQWRNAYEEGKLVLAEVKQDVTGSVTVRFQKEMLDGNAVIEQAFIIQANGMIKVNNRLVANKGKYPLLLRIGNNLQLNQALNQISYYGRGPGENYWDRKTGSFIGLYHQTLNEQYFPYARPQESGNKSDLRWVNFSNKNGKGLSFVMADSLLNFSALPYSIDDLDPETEKKQYHSAELIKRDKIYLHIDLIQSGVQGIDSWGSMPMKQYRVPFTEHEYAYWIKPIK